VGVANFLLDQSIGIDETNTFQFGRFVGVRVCEAYSHTKLALRTRLQI